jgi:hypothetical protein
LRLVHGYGMAAPEVMQSTMLLLVSKKELAATMKLIHSFLCVHIALHCQPPPAQESRDGIVLRLETAGWATTPGTET